MELSGLPPSGALCFPEYVDIPREPGAYALVFHLRRSRTLRIGRLGAVRLPAGYWVYVGSALGPGGLRARLGRHLMGSAQPRWHVDYLRKAARPVEVWFSPGRVRAEHVWATALAGMADGAVKGFGASDCRCGAHLFHFAKRPEAAVFATTVGAAVRSAALRARYPAADPTSREL